MGRGAIGPAISTTFLRCCFACSDSQWTLIKEAPWVFLVGLERSKIDKLYFRISENRALCKGRDSKWERHLGAEEELPLWGFAVQEWCHTAVSKEPMQNQDGGQWARLMGNTVLEVFEAGCMFIIRMGTESVSLELTRPQPAAGNTSKV